MNKKQNKTQKKMRERKKNYVKQKDANDFQARKDKRVQQINKNN